MSLFRYASLEKGHKGGSGSGNRRSSSRRSNSDAYDDHDESEEGECVVSGGSSKPPHYARPYLTEGTKSLQRGTNRQMQLPPSGGGGGNKSRRGGGGSSPWDSKPSPIYSNKISSWQARPSSASEAGGASVDRHRYFSTQALTVGCSDTEKERRQRLKGGRSAASSSSTVQLSGPQSASAGRRYGNEFTFEEEEAAYHGKGGIRKGSSRQSKYAEELSESGVMRGGSSRKLNMSPMDHHQQPPPHPLPPPSAPVSRYERTNSRPQPMEGKYVYHRQQQQQQPQHPYQSRNMAAEDGGMYEGDAGDEDAEEQGFESDFIAGSPIKSAGSLKNRPIFRFSTDYSNNNSPGVDCSPSAVSTGSGGGGGGQNGGGPQPRLRFNEKVKVSNYLEDKSDSLESPPGKGGNEEGEEEEDHFEDDFSTEGGDQWDESFTVPTGSRVTPTTTTKDKDIRKSESVNIFAKKSDDPFEDDDFFKTSGDEQPTTGESNNHFNWNHNFAKFEDNNIM